MPSNVAFCEGFSDACRGWACAANSVGRRPRSLRGRNRGGIRRGGAGGSLATSRLPGHIASPSALPPNRRHSRPASAFVPIASALPSGTDLQGGVAEGLFMTRSDLRAMRFTGIRQTEIQCFPLHLTGRGAGDPVTIMTGLDPDVSTLPGGNACVGLASTSTNGAPSRINWAILELASWKYPPRRSPLRVVILSLAFLLVSGCAPNFQVSCERDGYQKSSPEFSDCVDRKAVSYHSRRVPIRTIHRR